MSALDEDEIPDAMPQPQATVLELGQRAVFRARRKAGQAGGAAGKRFALPHSRVMIHQPLGGYRGQASDIQIHAQEILKIRDTLNRRLAHHSGQPLDKIERDTERDNFMSAQEAKDYGLVDEVLTHRI